MPLQSAWQKYAPVAAFLDAAPPTNVGYLEGTAYDFSAARASPTYTATSPSTFTTYCYGLTAGQSVVLTDGTYTGGGFTVRNCIGTAANPVVITCQSNWGALIRNLASGGFVIRDCAHVVIGGFDFDRTSVESTAGFRIELRDCNNVRFTGCRLNNFDTTKTIVGVTAPTGSFACYDNRIDHWLVSGASTGATGVGIFRTHYDTAYGAWPLRTTYDHITFDCTYGHEKPFDIMPDGNDNYSYCTIEYCESVDYTSSGSNNFAVVEAKGSGLTVRYNGIFLTSRLSRGYGINLRSTNDCQVYGNYIEKCSGIRVQGTGHVIHSNIIDDAGRGSTYWQFAIGSARWGNRTSGNINETGTYEIVNNTITNFNRTTANGGYAIHIGYDNGPYTTGPFAIDGTTIQGNIIQGIDGTLGYNEAGYVTNQTAGYNNFYATASAVNGNIYDGGTNDVTGNPSLDANFKPSGAAVGAGNYQANATFDYYGIARGTPYDIGAVTVAVAGGDVSGGFSRGLNRGLDRGMNRGQT